MNNLSSLLLRVVIPLGLLLGSCSPTPTPAPSTHSVEPPAVETTEADDRSAAFEDISFRYSPALAGDIFPEIIPTRSGPGFPPWEQSPSHIAFSFQNPYSQGLSLYWQAFTPAPAPKIFIYRTIDFPQEMLGWDGYVQIQALQVLLQERPTQVDGNLPLLPLTNAGQSFHAQMKYLEFQGGSGVRFITQYTQEMRTINNQELIYTFQGMTSDGAFYISALLPVRARSLPESFELAESDTPNFWANYATYLREAVDQMESLPAQAFEPDLEILDAVFQSLAFPFVAPTAVPSAPAATQTSTSDEVDIPAFVYPTPAPTLEAEYREYHSERYQVAFEIPAHWQMVADDHFQGPEGYFSIERYTGLASGLQDPYSNFSSRLVRACAWEVNEEPGRYGSVPLVYMRVVSYGQAQCLILPGEAGLEREGVLFFDAPGGKLGVLRADVRQMERIGNTFYTLPGFITVTPALPTGNSGPVEAEAQPARALGGPDGAALTLEAYRLFPADQRWPGGDLLPETLGSAGLQRRAWRETAPPLAQVEVGGKTVSWELEQAGLYSRLWVLVEGERVYAFLHPQSEPFLVRLHAWENQWVLEVDGSLVIDGRLANLDLGYGEIFGWQLVGGEPFFFFEKNGQYGVWYAGQELPVWYDLLLHRQTYMDEVEAFANENMAWFFALQDSAWYYVELGSYR